MGRATRPLWFSSGSHTNRFDLPNQGMLHASCTSITAYRGVLRVARVSAAMHPGVVDEEYVDMAPPGAVPISWTIMHAMTEFELVTRLPSWTDLRIGQCGRLGRV